MAIQVCQSIAHEDTKQREIDGLLDALETYHLNHGFILTESEEKIEMITKNKKHYAIRIIPIWKWLLEAIKN
ncbi:MAG: hypothetical protein ACD_29C00307G0002 [uncultured bacterium]|nr:MAG: hypothetical protein ACD_29C00307G0002 [uncultured bacterium]